MQTKLYKEVFEFEEVKVHKDLSKDKVIQEMKSLKARATEFEETKGEKDLLVVAVVNVGFYLDLEEYQPHELLLIPKDTHKSVGYKAPDQESTDGTEYERQYVLTTTGEPIGLAEYCTWIAAGPSTHVLQSLDFDGTKYARIETKHLNVGDDFHEF